MIDIDLNNNRNMKNLDILDKVIKVTHLSNRRANYNSRYKTYNPSLEQGNIVECQFIGIGSEFDDTHFAIVWSAPANKESILVIPLTSKNIPVKAEQFNLGKIENFVTSKTDLSVKDSYIYINKISEVSRVRVKLWYKKDNNGKPVKDSRNNNLAVKISEEQINRIKEGIQLFLIEGDTLLDILKNINAKWICNIGQDKSVLKQGHRLVKEYKFHDLGNKACLVCHMNEGVFRISFRQYDNERFKEKSKYKKIQFEENRIKRRNTIFTELFSKKEELVNEAETIINYIIDLN